MSRGALELFGFNDINSFVQADGQISSFLLDENFQPFASDLHLLQQITTSKMHPKLAFVKAQNKELRKICIFVDDFFSGKVGELAYEVNVIEISANASIDDEKCNRFMQNGLENKNETLKNEVIFSNLLEVCDKRNDDLLNVKIDNNWFLSNIRSLDISFDEFKEFLKAFLQIAREKEEILQEALLLGDDDTLKSVISILKDPAHSLNLEPVLASLNKLENSNRNSASDNFREFQNVLDEISKFIV